MKKFLYFIFSLIIIVPWLSNASQYGPNTIFQKPYETEEYIGNFIGTFCVGKTSKAYDGGGQVVPFLQSYGYEDLLLHFIDPYTNYDDLTKIGTIKFSGVLEFQCTNLSYYKNIMHHLFIGLGTIIQNLDINTIQSHTKISVPLTQEQERLLQIFEAKIPNNINNSGILSTYLELGYNQKFTNFQSINFLQALIKGLILTPQWSQGGDLSLLQYPLTGNITFGYQVVGTLVLGLTKHMNLGFFATVNPFQSKVSEVDYNEHIPNNQHLINKKIIASYTPGTVYNGVIYWEIGNFAQNFTLTAGVSSMYGSGRKIKPLSSSTLQAIATADINLKVNTTLDTWSITALLFELDYNFLTKENPEGPCLTLYFNTPITGYQYPKINGIGGEFGLTFNYKF